MNFNNWKSKDNHSHRIFVISLIGCLIVVISLFGYQFYDGLKNKAVLGTSDNATEKEIKKRLKQKVDPSILAVSINQIMYFQNGESQGIMNIENLPENNNDIQVEIYLEKEAILVYQTKYISPGYIIKKDKLLKKLDKGVYQAVATFIEVDSDQNEIKRVSANIEINIKN